MRRRHIAILPILAAIIFAGFQYFHSEKVTNPMTGKSARVALSSEQEQALGLQSYREVLSQSSVIEAGPEHDMVVRVARQLARATGDDAKDFQWQVSLVRSEQVNAFCLPGGKIVVYSGILPVAQTEEGLATVMGHEMAHAIARHGSQRMLRSSIAQTVLTGASFSMNDMNPRDRAALMAALGAGAQYGLILPFSRDQESEADTMGLIYMARAGYDPRAAVAFWERMGSVGGGQPPEFMSTHPSHGTRVARLNQMMPKALAEYKGGGSAMGGVR